MKVTEIIQLIQDESPLYDVYQADDIIGGQARMVYKNLDPEEHKGYRSATNIYQCDDGFVCITGPCKLYSETMNWRDLEEDCMPKNIQQFLLQLINKKNKYLYEIYKK